MIDELNIAMNEGYESLSKCYAKLQQRKHFRSPKIEAKIANLRFQHLSQGGEEDNTNLSKSPRKVTATNIYNDEFTDGKSAFEDSVNSSVITYADLANSNKMLIASATVNIYLPNAHVAMPVTTFKQITTKDKTVVSALRTISPETKSAYCNKVVQMAKMATSQAIVVRNFPDINIVTPSTTPQKMSLSGWEKGTNGKHMLYVSYETSAPVSAVGVYILPVHIKGNNYWRGPVTKIRWHEKSHTDIKYRYKYSVYYGNERRGCIAPESYAMSAGEYVEEKGYYCKRAYTKQCRIESNYMMKYGLPSNRGFEYVDIEASNGQGCKAVLHR